MYEEYCVDDRSFERDLLAKDTGRIKALVEELVAIATTALSTIATFPEMYAADTVDDYDGKLTKVEKELLKGITRIDDKLQTIAAQRFPRRIRK